MAVLPIYDRTGKEVGSYTIDPADVSPRISKQLLHDVVVMYQANQRQGTFRTKARGEVAGSTKKLYDKKGRVMPVQVRAARELAGVAGTFSPSDRGISRTGCRGRPCSWRREWRLLRGCGIMRSW